MTLLLWVIIALSVGTAIGKVARMREPQMSEPKTDGFDAVANVILAGFVLWAIAKQWSM